MKIRIVIEYQAFNYEYNADIQLSPDNIIGLASDDLGELLNTIKMRVLEFNNKMVKK